MTPDARAAMAREVLTAYANYRAGQGEHALALDARAYMESVYAAPAPVSSSPPRWWLVIDARGTAYRVYEWEERLLADRRTAELNRTGDPYAPFSVLPVLEARVTREMEDRVAQAIYDHRDSGWRESAIAVIRALGLTVEGDDHA